MRKKLSITSFISFTISIIAFVLYVILLSGINVYILWIVSSITALFLPLLSKYVRTQNKMKGAGLEVAALVIGSFDFYFVIFAATSGKLLIAYAIIAVTCILYGKLFKEHPTKNDSYNNIKFSLSAENGTNTLKEGHLTYGSDIALEMPTHTSDEVTSKKMETTPNIPNTSEAYPNTNTESTIPQKLRYCSRCGSIILKTATRCPGCERRILRINKFSVTVFLLLLITIGLAVLNIIQYKEILSLKDYISWLEYNLF